jgi:photosystem II stability/assembly factor-like uncharacterized protein
MDVGNDLYVSHDGGETWGTTISFPDSASQISGLASSYNGKHLYIAIGYLYMSHDFGATWEVYYSLQGPCNISCSRNGSKVVFCYTSSPGYTCISSDYGATWTYQSGLPLIPHGACDITGEHIVIAGASGAISLSTNGGSSWSSVTPYDHHWHTVACDEDMSVIVACANDGWPWLSIDSGANWTEQIGGPPQHSDWMGSSVSGDGQRFMASAYRHCYGSVDQGANWVDYTWPESVSYEGVTVSISGNGEYVIAASYLYGKCYTMGVVSGVPHSFPWVGRFQLVHVIEA